MDEVETSEGGAATGAGGDLVLYPAELGRAGQAGQVEAEFFAELAGERGWDFLVGVDDAAGY